MKSRVVRVTSNLFAFVAAMFVTVPCNGKFHEPKMPAELRTQK